MTVQTEKKKGSAEAALTQKKGVSPMRKVIESKLLELERGKSPV